MAERSVLVVDDNGALVEDLAEIMEDQGWSAAGFVDPRAACQRVTPGAFVAALVDMRMPGMDGADLAGFLLRADPALPIIAMTAFATDAALASALRRGVSVVMPKPVEPGQLVQRLRTIMEAPRVLVVEDDIDLAQNLVEALLDAGLSARSAWTAAQARSICPAWRPRALVVDARLPDGDGTTLATELKRGTSAPAGGAILISGHSAELERAETSGGVQGVMAKPLDVGGFIGRVRAALGAEVAP